MFKPFLGGFMRRQRLLHLVIASAVCGLVVVSFPYLAQALDPDGKVPSNIYLRAPDGGTERATGNGRGAAKTVGDYPLNTRGCMQAICLPGGDGGVIAGTIPVDGGTYYPQANTRYTATVTSNSAVRVSNGTPCIGFAEGQGRVFNANSTLTVTTSTNPDGGTGNLSMPCCAASAGTATDPTLIQLCPE